MKNEVNKEYTLNLGDELDVREPSLLRVLVHKDDFTPREFVVKVLEMFFYMSRQKAVEVMMEAQIKGKAICGIFSKDFAEAKVSQIEEYARENEHPLLCSSEVA